MSAVEIVSVRSAGSALAGWSLTRPTVIRETPNGASVMSQECRCRKTNNRSWSEAAVTPAERRRCRARLARQLRAESHQMLRQRLGGVRDRCSTRALMQSRWRLGHLSRGDRGPDPPPRDEQTQWDSRLIETGMAGRHKAV